MVGCSTIVMCLVVVNGADGATHAVEGAAGDEADFERIGVDAADTR